MRKPTPIKWRDVDRKELAKMVRKFNAKRTRLIKQVPDLEEFLPAKVSVSTLKEEIYSRSDFKKTIKRLNRFMEKGAENMVTTKSGVRTTKYQVREFKINKAIINRKRSQMRKEADVSTYKGTMGAIKDMNLRPKKLNVQKIKKSMWAEIVQNFERQSMDKYYVEHDDLYKKNYLKAFTDAFGGSSQATALRKEIESLPPNVIVDMFYYDPNLQIDFLYPVDDEEAEQNLQFFTDTFHAYLDEMVR